MSKFNAEYKKILEEVNINDLSGGAFKNDKIMDNVYAVLYRNEPVVLENGDKYQAAGPLSSRQLAKGMIVAGFYNSTNQGFDLYEILGFTDDKSGHGDKFEKTGKVDFESAKQLYAHYGVNSLKALEEKQQSTNEYGFDSRLCVKDINSGETGAWFYMYEGRWARGSGAEKLSFILMKKIDSNTDTTKNEPVVDRK